MRLLWRTCNGVYQWWACDSSRSQISRRWITLKAWFCRLLSPSWDKRVYACVYQSSIGGVISNLESSAVADGPFCCARRFVAQKMSVRVLSVICRVSPNVSRNFVALVVVIVGMGCCWSSTVLVVYGVSVGSQFFMQVCSRMASIESGSEVWVPLPVWMMVQFKNLRGVQSHLTL